MKLKHLEIWLFTVLITLLSLYIGYCKIVPRHSEFTIYIPKTIVTAHVTEKTQTNSEKSEAETFLNVNSVININTANAEELKSLNGIGDVLAQRIVEYRAANGDFQSTQDIMNVRGIGEGIFAKIVNNITV